MWTSSRNGVEPRLLGATRTTTERSAALARPGRATRNRRRNRRRTLIVNKMTMIARAEKRAAPRSARTGRVPSRVRSPSSPTRVAAAAGASVLDVAVAAAAAADGAGRVAAGAGAAAAAAGVVAAGVAVAGGAAAAAAAAAVDAAAAADCLRHSSAHGQPYLPLSLSLLRPPHSVDHIFSLFHFHFLLSLSYVFQQILVLSFFQPLFKILPNL